MKLGLAVILWIIVLIGLRLSVAIYHHVQLPRSRWRLTLALLVVPSILIMVVLIGTGEWMLGLPMFLIFIVYSVLISAWAWKVDKFADDLLKKRFDQNPEMRTQMERNPVLRIFVRRRR